MRANLHTRPRARQDPLGCREERCNQKSPSHLLAQLQTPLSTPISGLCLLLASFHFYEDSLVGTENKDPETLEQEAVSCPFARFVSA